VNQRRPTSNFSSLDNLPHPAQRLMRSYAHQGAPVKFATPPWTCQQLQRASKRGPYRSALQYIEFLCKDFVDMINKGQWMVLPAKDVLHLPGLRLSPPGVVPRQGRRPQWICDNSWWVLGFLWQIRSFRGARTENRCFYPMHILISEAIGH
jgi:hypothetical protein